MDNLRYDFFSNIDLSDPFFDSLKADYAEFSDWYLRKANEQDQAYVLYDGETNAIDGFMYLKFEQSIDDINVPIFNSRILKIGTFKFNAKGTSRGQRFVKKSLDLALEYNMDYVYFTAFSKQETLINMFLEYGFYQQGYKDTPNGREFVYIKDMTRQRFWGDTVKDYPYVHQGYNKYLLSIYPMYHTRLFPDSKLVNESPNIIQDVSFTNSIHKIYISGAYNAADLKRGDIAVIYRTSDGQGSAYHRSVVTSICVVEEVKHRNEFADLNEYLQYCKKFSIFTEQELIEIYNKNRYPYIIKFSYNYSFPKRINRKILLEEVGLSGNDRWTLLQLTDAQFYDILRLTESNENIIIN